MIISHSHSFRRQRRTLKNKAVSSALRLDQSLPKPPLTAYCQATTAPKYTTWVTISMFRCSDVLELTLPARTAPSSRPNWILWTTRPCPNRAIATPSVMHIQEYVDTRTKPLCVDGAFRAPSYVLTGTMLAHGVEESGWIHRNRFSQRTAPKDLKLISVPRTKPQKFQHGGRGRHGQALLTDVPPRRAARSPAGLGLEICDTMPLCCHAPRCPPCFGETRRRRCDSTGTLSRCLGERAHGRQLARKPQCSAVFVSSCISLSPPADDGTEKGPQCRGPCARLQCALRHGRTGLELQGKSIAVCIRAIVTASTDAGGTGRRQSTTVAC